MTDRMTIVGKDGEDRYITEGEKVTDLAQEKVCPGCLQFIEFCLCEKDQENQENE